MRNESVAAFVGWIMFPVWLVFFAALGAFYIHVLVLVAAFAWNLI